MTLFRLDASIRVDGSASREIADIVEAEWLAAHPGDTVERRHIGVDVLPADAWAHAVSAGFVAGGRPHARAAGGRHAGRRPARRAARRRCHRARRPALQLRRLPAHEGLDRPHHDRPPGRRRRAAGSGRQEGRARARSAAAPTAPAPRGRAGTTRPATSGGSSPTCGAPTSPWSSASSPWSGSTPPSTTSRTPPRRCTRWPWRPHRRPARRSPRLTGQRGILVLLRGVRPANRPQSGDVASLSEAAAPAFPSGGVAADVTVAGAGRRAAGVALEAVGRPARPSRSPSPGAAPDAPTTGWSASPATSRRHGDLDARVADVLGHPGQSAPRSRDGCGNVDRHGVTPSACRGPAGPSAISLTLRRFSPLSGTRRPPSLRRRRATWDLHLTSATRPVS